MVGLGLFAMVREYLGTGAGAASAFGPMTLKNVIVNSLLPRSRGRS